MASITDFVTRVISEGPMAGNSVGSFDGKVE